MGLDVYSGTLIRYYLSYWLLTVEFLPASTRGRNPDRLLKRPSRKDIAGCGLKIEQWKARLSKRFRGKIASLAWKDDIDRPYSVDKPTWDAYASFYVWAAYAMTPSAKPPRDKRGVDFSDPVWKARSRDKTSPISTLWSGADTWLPGPYDFVFRAKDPFGKMRHFGWTKALLSDLKWINARTWKAPDRTIRRWRLDWGRDESQIGVFEHDAKFVFSIYYKAAQEAVRHGHAVVLDY